jgi:hypothetical protein
MVFLENETGWQTCKIWGECQKQCTTVAGYQGLHLACLSLTGWVPCCVVSVYRYYTPTGRRKYNLRFTAPEFTRHVVQVSGLRNRKPEPAEGADASTAYDIFECDSDHLQARKAAVDWALRRVGGALPRPTHLHFHLAVWVTTGGGSPCAVSSRRGPCRGSGCYRCVPVGGERGCWGQGGSEWWGGAAGCSSVVMATTLHGEVWPARVVTPQEVMKYEESQGKVATGKVLVVVLCHRKSSATTPYRCHHLQQELLPTDCTRVSRSELEAMLEGSKVRRTVRRG